MRPDFDPSLKRRAILIVDDEPHILSAISRAIMSRYRHGLIAVEVFERPADALARAKVKAFDAVISDMRMPQMDGAAFLAAFRVIQPDCPRVMLSARADMEQLARAVNMGGICRFCEKPWLDELLLDVIEEEIQKAEALAENARMANEKRVEAGDMTEEAEARRLFAKEHPALANVSFDPDGSVRFD